MPRELVSDIVASCKACGGVGDGTQLELPDLANKITRFPVKFQFQTNKEYFFFLL